MSLVEDIKSIQRAVGAHADGIFGPRTAAAVLAHLGRMEMVELPGEAGLDERTLGNLETLDTKARDRFEQLCLVGKATAATFGCDWIMISGHRSWDEQNALFAKGRTAPGPVVTTARGGYSNHNFGIAADFGVFQGRSYLDSADPQAARRVHEAVAIHARKLGFEWGGDWKAMKDYPHFELATGLSLQKKRELYKERGSVL